MSVHAAPHFPHRYCERNEAIQLGMDGWARRLRLIAMTIMFPLVSTPAFACMEMKPLFYRLNSSQIIFEGHIDRLEQSEVFNARSQEHIYSIFNIYKVDKNWKGTQVGEEYRVKPQYNFFRFSEQGFVSKPKDTSKKIMTLSNPGKDGTVSYFQEVCPEFYPVTWLNKLLLTLRFPVAAIQ